MCGQRRGRFPRERGVAVGSSTATTHGANVDAGDETVRNEANDIPRDGDAETVGWRSRNVINDIIDDAGSWKGKERKYESK